MDSKYVGGVEAGFVMISPVYCIFRFGVIYGSDIVCSLWISIFCFEPYKVFSSKAKRSMPYSFFSTSFFLLRIFLHLDPILTSY